MIEVDGREYRTERQWARIHRAVTDAGRKRGVEKKWRSPRGNQSATFYPRSATRKWTASEINAEKRARAEAERRRERTEFEREIEKKWRVKVAQSYTDGLAEGARLATGTPFEVPLLFDANDVAHGARCELYWLRRGYVPSANARWRDGLRHVPCCSVWDVRYDPKRASVLMPVGPASGRAISLDIETTGLSSEYVEILSLGICDAETGEELWNRTYKPEHVADWPEAEAINGIGPATVADCPHISTDAEEVKSIIYSADRLVVYNAPFDMGFLYEAGIAEGLDAYLIDDSMLEFAEAYGEWDERHDRWRWLKLVDAADYIEYEWDDSAHNALADARASAAVWRWLRGREGNG